MNLITHSGTFHADDLIAYSILSGVFPHYPLIRTRDDAALANPPEGSVVFDVGLRYDPKANLFDHHQKGGAGVRPNGVPYAASGLVWKAYGKTYINNLAGFRGYEGFDVAAVHELVDRTFIQVIDALDCGAVDSHQALAGSPDVLFPELSLPVVLMGFNPVPLLDSEDPEAITVKFREASEFCRQIVDRTVKRAISRELGRQFLEQADTGGPFIVLDQFVSWQDYALERERVLYVVFPSDNQWKCQAVPVADGSFVSRKPLPAAWAGLDGKALCDLTGVEDAVFCANQRFICGARSKAGALRLCELALQQTA